MSEYFHHVLVGLLAVLPVANPLTSVSLLLGLGGSLPPAERNRQIFKASLYVALIMLVSFYGGSLVMQVFGISIPGLRIAGGLIVAYIGFTMLFPATTPDETEVQHDLLSDEEKITPHFRDLSFVPLALPGTAGRGPSPWWSARRRRCNPPTEAFRCSSTSRRSPSPCSPR
ncbi:inner membrane protein [Pseudomonas aeruginosa]|nr:inner membrane protein [Pseudomonas aeruginosa]